MPPYLRVFILSKFQNGLKNREYGFSHFEAEQIQKMATNIFLEVEQVTDYEGAEVIHNGGRTGLLVRTGRDGDGHTE